MRSLLLKLVSVVIGTTSKSGSERKLIIAEWLITLVTVAIIYLIISIFV